MKIIIVEKKCQFANMKTLATLRKQSLDICAVREFLDYPETFQMEQGITITPNLNTPYQIELQE